MKRAQRSVRPRRRGGYIVTDGKLELAQLVTLTGVDVEARNAVASFGAGLIVDTVAGRKLQVAFEEILFSFGLAALSK